MAIVTSWRAPTWPEGDLTPSPVGFGWSDLPICKHAHPSCFYGNFPYVFTCWQLLFVVFENDKPNQTNLQPGWDLQASNLCPLPIHPPGPLWQAAPLPGNFTQTLGRPRHVYFPLGPRSCSSDSHNCLLDVSM